MGGNGEGWSLADIYVEIDIPSIEVRYFAAILKRVNSLSYRGGYCVTALSSLFSDQVCSILSA
jgi:hypothetical protein